MYSPPSPRPSPPEKNPPDFARLVPRNRRRPLRSADWQSAVSPVGNRRACRLPVGETAGYQPALRRGYWAGSHIVSSRKDCRVRLGPRPDAFLLLLHSTTQRLRGESIPGFGREPFVLSRHPLVFGRHSPVSGRRPLVFDRQTIPIGRRPLVFDRQTIPIGRRPLVFDRQTILLRRHSRGFHRYPLEVCRLPGVARTLVERSRRAVGYHWADAAGKFFPVQGSSCRV